MVDDKVKDKMMYVLRQEVVSQACSNYGLFTAAENRAGAIPVIEPQGKISDLVKLMQHDFKGSHWLALRFDRPQDIPELSVDIDYYREHANHVTRYSSLSPAERKEFIAQMSGYRDYGTKTWLDEKAGPQTESE